LPSVKKYKKEIMKRFILASTIFCICACTTLKAQIPGYMGKRFTLSYNAYMAPNIGAILGLNEVNMEEKIPFRLNTKHILEADYVIGRRVSAGFELGFMRHNVPIVYDQFYKPDPQSEWYSSRAALGEVKLNGYAVGFNFKFYGLFTKNALAPLGSYLVLSGQRLVYNLNDENGYTASGRNDTTTIRNITAKNAGMLLAIGFGTRRIYYNKVSLDFAMTSSIAVALPKEESYNGAGDFATSYALSRHLLMYKIGIGGLLF